MAEPSVSVPTTLCVLALAALGAAACPTASSESGGVELTCYWYGGYELSFACFRDAAPAGYEDIVPPAEVRRLIDEGLVLCSYPSEEEACVCHGKCGRVRTASGEQCGCYPKAAEDEEPVSSSIVAECVPEPGEVCCRSTVNGSCSCDAGETECGFMEEEIETCGPWEMFGPGDELGGGAIVVASCEAAPWPAPVGESESGSHEPGDYSMHYDAGASALLRFTVDIELAFEAVADSVMPEVPEIDGRTAFAESWENGSGVQSTSFTVSTSETSVDEGDQIYFEFTIERANDNPDAAALDAGEPVEVSCGLGWADRANGRDWNTFSGGRCRVEFDGGGFSVEILEDLVEGNVVDWGAMNVTGTVTFAPVPVSPALYNVECPSGQLCLSLDPTELVPGTGWCLPEENLKSAAAPCDASCEHQLEIETGGETQCVCSSVCGYVEGGGGGDPPVCDPSYGCIDF